MKLYNPLKHTLITQGFGLLNTIPSMTTMYQELGLLGHNGIDFSALYGFPGHPEIYYNASVRGTVYKTGVYADGCKYISIIVQNEGKTYQLRYLHLWDFMVTPGQILEGGELIAHADNTGKYTTGQHLHFDMSLMIQSGNSYNYAESNNGYGGQTDPTPYYENIFICDLLDNLNAQIGLIQKILEIIKKILSLKVA